jgi:hypothetical protein
LSESESGLDFEVGNEEVREIWKAHLDSVVGNKEERVRAWDRSLKNVQYELSPITGGFVNE